MKNIANIVPRQRGHFLFVVGLLLSGAVLMFMTVLIRNNTHLISENWHRFSVDRSEKVQVVSTLRRELGFGGMIHQFKNFLLRNDPYGRERMRENLGGATSAILRYRALGVDSAETTALDALSDMLQNYRDASLIARNMFENGASVVEVDRTVKVDDRPALAALTILSEKTRPEKTEDEHVLAKAFALEVLRAAIGYGGMIHEFKNFVLRGGAVRISSFRTQIEKANGALNTYGRERLTQGEESALNKLRAMLDTYSRNIDRAREMRAQGQSPKGIDLIVRVDDKPALEALAFLDRQRQLQIETASSAVSGALEQVSQLTRFGLWITLVLLLALFAGSIWTLSDRQRRETLLGNAVKALRKSRTQLTEAQRIAQLGSWDLDLVSRSLNWSDEIYRIFEIDPVRFGTSYEAFLDAIHPDDREMVDKAYTQSLTDHLPYTIIHRLCMADGRIKWVHEHCETEFDADGKPLVSRGTMQDITEKRLAEEKLQQAQKMEAVGQLTGGVAHDFNNLLTVILGNLQLIAKRLDDPAMSQMAQSAIQASRRSAELTQRLLAFSRKQSLAPAAIEMDRLIGNMTDLLRRSLGETIEIEVPEAGDLWQCQADPGQLENTILNLALNARDAMPHGGSLTIETANLVLDDADIAAREDVSPGEYVMIAISDSGTGMSRDVIDHAFEPFFTTKDVGAGSGLGLSMVHGFINQSGGFVTIDSTEDVGTTVKLHLPRTVATCAPSRQSPKEEEPSAQGEKILVVEDDPDVRALTLSLLGDLGYETVEAANGKEAMDALTRTPGIDLLFTDVVLPGGMSGVDIVKEATRDFPNLKVLFTSGYADDVLRRHGESNTNVELVHKPFQKEELAQKLRAAMGGSIH